ncbi:MAG: SH3 domain-containing protein [Rhizobiales bacterium]|nr:SH3 domain-containing protein [Hyphomicrobiales bacterium]
MRTMLLSAAILAGLAGQASATSGPGCLVVHNVARNDVLNMRARPTQQSRIVDALIPGRHGIIHLDRPCGPASKHWGSRWCKVSHYDGGRVTRGYVKARFVRDSDCP